MLMMTFRPLHNFANKSQIRSKSVISIIHDVQVQGTGRAVGLDFVEKKISDSISHSDGRLVRPSVHPLVRMSVGWSRCVFLYVFECFEHF